MQDQREEAARRFAEEWKDRGYEKGEAHSFWLSLLHQVYGVENPERYIRFETQVKLDTTSFIDGNKKDLWGGWKKLYFSCQYQNKFIPLGREI